MKAPRRLNISLEPFLFSSYKTLKNHYPQKRKLHLNFGNCKIQIPAGCLKIAQNFKQIFFEAIFENGLMEVLNEEY